MFSELSLPMDENRSEGSNPHLAKIGQNLPELIFSENSARQRVSGSPRVILKN